MCTRWGDGQAVGRRFAVLASNVGLRTVTEGVLDRINPRATCYRNYPALVEIPFVKGGLPSIPVLSQKTRRPSCHIGVDEEVRITQVGYSSMIRVRIPSTTILHII